MNEPELGAGIDPGMSCNPFPSSILDKTRFEPTTNILVFFTPSSKDLKLKRNEQQQVRHKAQSYKTQQHNSANVQ
jgi:hypothetical protein